MRATYLLLALLVACGGTEGTDSQASPPTWCGDGTVDDGEDCNDGDESATCDLDCTVASCGDGRLNPTAGEACDDAGESAFCNADCS